MTLKDTIAAISTPPGRGGIGIVRLSGPDAVPIAERVLRFPRGAHWRSWHAQMAQLPGPDGEPVDEVIVTFYKAPRSYTAEDVVEISCHGSPVVLRYCLERLLQEGARLAQPGEFTMRAFLNGRIDLPQAEAVRELIEATTLFQAKMAARQLDGALSRRIQPIKDRLLELIALLEAGIDFAEDDVPVASDEEILARLRPIRDELKALLATFDYGRVVFSGFTLAIVGRPNVGKSSLFNRLLEQDRAIVTDIPGTTRDLVSETASIGGIPVRLVDTAGIRSTTDIVESIGVERSFQAMADADLSLVVFDISQPLTEEDHQLISRAASTGRYLLVANKADLPHRAELPDSALIVSAKTGEGIEQLRQKILEQVAPPDLLEHESGFITSVRHQQHVREAVEGLDRAEQAVLEHLPHEMILIDLYSGLQALDALTGATTAEDILNRIFSTFCIGK